MKPFLLSLLLGLVIAPAAFAADATSVNIRDFGAIPNDGLDDGPAIQMAFNAVSPYGGTVLCPTGTYDIYTPIIVNMRAVRFAGYAGPAYNEDPPYAGCTLVAHTDGMTVLQFTSPVLRHNGPIIEYINFRDSTPTGHTAVLLDIKNTNRWTVRNITVNYAKTGLKVTGTVDASWGYVAQLFCKDSITCIDQSLAEGGFTLLGGGLEPKGIGVRIRGAQVRIMGVKFDCVNGATGVYITGHADVIADSIFEQCGTGIAVRDDTTQTWNGDQNRFIGNHFLGSDIAGSKGISLGVGADNNELVGNTYEYPAINVEDLGRGNLRLERGMGPDLDVACPAGQAVRGLRIRQGIIASASCAAP